MADTVAWGEDGMEKLNYVTLQQLFRYLGLSQGAYNVIHGKRASSI
jgi:hypothetical protein